MHHAHPIYLPRFINLFSTKGKTPVKNFFMDAGMKTVTMMQTRRLIAACLFS
jgi:hypothetical protein